MEEQPDIALEALHAKQQEIKTTNGTIVVENYKDNQLFYLEYDVDTSTNPYTFYHLVYINEQIPVIIAKQKVIHPSYVEMFNALYN